MQASTQLEKIYSIYDARFEIIRNDFFEFLRFPSISTIPEYAGDIRNCANWLAHYLGKVGFDVELWETSGYPVVYATWLNAGKDKPTILIYNHYDVQPADPLELWKSPPFEPNVRNKHVYARGASDNKGQCFYTISALAALLETTGSLPVNVKLCIEGEEESQSVGLHQILKTKQKELKADAVFVVDLGFPAPNIPAITLGLRGILAIEVEFKGSDIDLHSGTHGGIVYNPNHALIEVLGKLRDSSGRITVPEFYDSVIQVTDKTRSQIDFDVPISDLLGPIGAQATGGESQFSPIESGWIRPTLEINGINGGYTGKGFKTVIPAKATAKLSCRLALGQDPEKIANSISEFIKTSAPKGIEVKTHIFPGGANAILTSPESSAAKAAFAAYSEVYGKTCRRVLCGASIPIAPDLQAISKGDLVLIGSALTSDAIHSPNENFALDRFREGFATIWRILEILGVNS